jgi:hypothetical protein
MWLTPGRGRNGLAARRLAVGSPAGIAAGIVAVAVGARWQIAV